MESKAVYSPKPSLAIFFATSLFGLVLAFLVQWIFRGPLLTPDSPSKVTVAYMNAHAGQSHQALLAFVNPDGEQFKVDDVDWTAPKWVETAWEQLVANKVDVGVDGI